MRPRRLLVAGWLVFILYAYPGYMLTEGADMMVDTRYGNVTDWHSPIMTKLWELVALVLGGPPGMLLVQSILLLVGSYRLFSRVFTEKAAAIAALVVLLLPPLMATTAVICPEALLASLLVASAASLTSQRFGWRVVGLVLAMLAAGMRDAGALAAFVVVASLFRWRTPLAGWRRVLVGVATAAVVTTAGVGTARSLPAERSEHAEAALAMSDIIGTLSFASDESDDVVKQQLAGVSLAASHDLQRRARSLYERQFAYAGGDDRMFDPPETAAQRAALFDARDRLAKAAPLAYLQHRTRAFARGVGLFRTGAWTPVYTKHTQRPEDVETAHHLARSSLVQRALIAIVRVPRNTFLFHPYFYLFLAIPLFVYSLVKRRHLAAIFLGTALAYAVALFVLANRSEYRDGHPIVTFTVLGTIMLLALQAWHKRVGDQAPLGIADDDDIQARKRRT